MSMGLAVDYSTKSALITIHTKRWICCQLILKSQILLSDLLEKPIGWAFSTSVACILDDGTSTFVADDIISRRGALKIHRSLISKEYFVSLNL